jgi:hypothetical protein
MIELHSGFLWCLQVKARTILWNRPRLPPPLLWSILDTSAFHGRVATILPDQHVTRVHLPPPPPPPPAPNFKPIRPVTFTTEAVFLITLHCTTAKWLLYSLRDDLLKLKIACFYELKSYNADGCHPIKNVWLKKDIKFWKPSMISEHFVMLPVSNVVKNGSIQKVYFLFFFNVSL